MFPPRSTATELILLRGARQVITLRGPPSARRGPALKELQIIEDGSVLIEDGKIASVGSTRRLENLKKARNAVEIDVQGCVVMPGFVDPGLSASLQSSNASKRKLKRTTEVYDDSLQLMRACLQHGTLTAEVKASGEESQAKSVISVLRQLAKIGDSPIRMVRTWKLGKSPASVKEIDDFSRSLDVVSRRQLAKFVELTVGDGYYLNPDLLQILAQSKFGLKMTWTGNLHPSQMAAVLSIGPQAIACSTAMHLAQTRLPSHYPGVFVFPPVHELRQSNGRGLRQLVEAGGAIALSSGYDPRHASRFSMQTAVCLTVLRGELSLEEAIVAATVNAAYAVGLGNRVGTLEVGKYADILVLAISDYREITRQCGLNHVGMVLRNGNLVFNRGRWKKST